MTTLGLCFWMATSAEMERRMFSLQVEHMLLFCCSPKPFLVSDSRHTFNLYNHINIWVCNTSLPVFLKLCKVPIHSEGGVFLNTKSYSYLQHSGSQNVVYRVPPCCPEVETTVIINMLTDFHYVDIYTDSTKTSAVLPPIKAMASNNNSHYMFQCHTLVK